uniref:Uncharacterized protein n=1 Tax=Brassica campestris TaxID=3711 RepID=A0A3P6BLG1_BRACM|nr:unnamed protein product [Brassica rapa]
MFTDLQHLVRILVLSYERGMTLNADYLKTLLVPVAVPKSRMCHLAPRPLHPSRRAASHSFRVNGVKRRPTSFLRFPRIYSSSDTFSEVDHTFGATFPRNEFVMQWLTIAPDFSLIFRLKGSRKRI